MPETKATTRSLRVAGNPQARMQELLRGQPQAEEPADPPAITSLPENVVLTSSNQDSMTDSKQDDSIASKIDELKDEQQDILQSGQPPRKKGSKPATATPVDLDPVDAALLQKIGRMYPDLAKESSTLVSSRLPNELVSRLDAATSLVKKYKKNKQDVIARGLILAFEELVKHDGDVAWYE